MVAGEALIIQGISAQAVAQRELAEQSAREIVKGQWSEENEMAGQLHGLLAKRVLRKLDNFVEEHQLGEVYPDSTTYILEGTPQNIITQRVPDVSFVGEARVNRAQVGAMEFAPDLAIEILSPTERAGQTAGKIADYLQHGTQQVWVIDPESQQIAVHFPDGRVKVYPVDETLTAPDLLPNFELKLSEIFT